MSTIADLKNALQNASPSTIITITVGTTAVSIAAGDLDLALGIPLPAINPPPPPQTGTNTTMYATNRLNVRDNPTTSGNIVEVLPAGTALTIIASTASVTADGHTWLSIQTPDGKTGWCASDFLSSSQPSGSGGSTSPGLTNGPLLADLSQWNSGVNLAQAKAAGLSAVMHKATQGLTLVDSSFAARKDEAAAAGLPFGAYHFGVGQFDPVQQAEHLLSVAAGVSVLVLDYEKNPDSTGESMSIAQAEAFVQHIHDRTGRWPLIYTSPGYWNGQNSQVAAQCPLWVAAWGDSPIVPSPWHTWTLWQFTDGNNGPAPHTLNGLSTQTDMDRFNGDQSALAQFFQG